MSDSNYSSYISFSKSIFNLENSIKETSNLYSSNSSNNNNNNNNQLELKYKQYTELCSNDNVFHCDINTYKNLVNDFSK